MADSGFPLEWFAEPVEDHLKCGICSKVLRDPTVTKCGHIYCEQCLYHWVDYYGVCPERCREVELDSLKRSLHVQKLISGLLTGCKNKIAGCPVQVPLAEKHQHERTCPYQSGAGFKNKKSKRDFLHKRQVSAPAAIEENDYVVHHKKTKKSIFFSNTRLSAIARSPSSAAILCRTEDARPMPIAMNSKGSCTEHTFRLKRTKTKEPLGLVLVSGEKTPDGRPYSFYVKKVHPDTLGWKAGLQAEDRIIKVDNYELASIVPQEAVARIKEKTLVTLTVLRGVDCNKRSGERADRGIDDHVYDEILYTDFQLSQNLSQQDENTPINMASGGYPKSSKGRVPMSRGTSHHHLHTCKGRDKGGSKDSGLSSGSSTHHLNNEEGRVPTFPDPYRNRVGSQGSRSDSGRNEDYEVEDIYLQKNGTSQLGITLGYDTKSANGQLAVCEIVPNGLAAQQGRLKRGDIIQRVNGFEVHDPEEAILLFLEQDQDITLTVARPTKVVPSHKPPHRTTSSTHLHPHSYNPHHHDTGHAYLYPNRSQEDHHYALLDSNMAPPAVRRVDSCGTLDSHHYQNYVEEQEGVYYDQPIKNQQTHHSGYDKMRRTKSASSPSRNMRTREVHRNRSPPVRQPSPLVTDSNQPVYQVLQRPGSSSPSFSSHPPSFQNEEFRPFSAAPPDTRVKNRGQLSSTKGSTQQRSTSTVPHHKHRIDSEGQPPSPTSPTTKASHTFHSITNERCDTVPADFFFNRTESLV